jgi:hypothetical protein
MLGWPCHFDIASEGCRNWTMVKANPEPRPKMGFGPALVNLNYCNLPATFHNCFLRLINPNPNPNHVAADAYYLLTDSWYCQL